MKACILIWISSTGNWYDFLGRIIKKKLLELETSDLIAKMADEIEEYGLINKQKEVNTALAIDAMFAAERLNNKNNAYLNALNTKNPEQIETAVTELTSSIDTMKLWVMRYLKPVSYTHLRDHETDS